TTGTCTSSAPVVKVAAGGGVCDACGGAATESCGSASAMTSNDDAALRDTVEKECGIMILSSGVGHIFMHLRDQAVIQPACCRIPAQPRTSLCDRNACPQTRCRRRPG